MINLLQTNGKPYTIVMFNPPKEDDDLEDDNDDIYEEWL